MVIATGASKETQQSTDSVGVGQTEPSSGGGVRQSLRGMSYDEGAALLSPGSVQMKPVQMARGGKGKKGKKGKDESPPEPENRGRLQIQGGGLEYSWPWAGAAPSQEAALAGLDGLWDGLTKTEQGERDEAYPKARRYIEENPNVAAPVSVTFQNKNRPKSKTGKRDQRIDIEVWKGIAFTD